MQQPRGRMGKMPACERNRERERERERARASGEPDGLASADSQLMSGDARGKSEGMDPSRGHVGGLWG